MASHSTDKGEFRSSQTEWDEVEAVVNHIIKLRGVRKVSMIGWSTGTPRIGGFAAKHPDKVDRIVFFAPAPFFQSERNRKVLHEASRQWLQSGAVNGRTKGMLNADAQGRIQ